VQYIKKYNLELYNKILALQRREKMRTVLQRIVNKAKRKLNLEKLIIPPQEQVDEIIDIACDYMGIDKCDYYEAIDRFNNCGMNMEGNFETQSQADVLWSNIGKEWLCINIYVQSVLYNTVIPVYTTLRKLLLNSLTVLDYGCGSGVMAILLHKAFKFKRLVLTDIDNYAANFVRFYIEKTNSKEIIWKNILEYNSDETFDFVECFDVLEHLENSYEHLLKLDGKVRNDGIMALKIAFECEDETHLPQASESFFVKNDGLAYLGRRYKRIKYFGDGIVSGVYKKLGNFIQA
jgi:2-polyprenyl-3-methyl-5-hydroxy-6-metoxy-1,4-benzoquinol methylase